MHTNLAIRPRMRPIMAVLHPTCHQPATSHMVDPQDWLGCLRRQSTPNQREIASPTMVQFGLSDGPLHPQTAFPRLEPPRFLPFTA